jgi:large subunit ribosomal protein L6
MSVAIATSRIGRKPVTVPSGVDVKMKDGQLTAKGPKGQLVVELHPYVSVSIEGNEIKVRPNTEGDHVITGARIKLYRSIAGTVRSNIYNVIHGVSQGFERALQLVGVGYKAQAKGKVLSLNLGFSHPTDFPVPEGIVIETPSPTDIIIKGMNKELVGLVAAKIRSIRGPEPYKGKGVRYANEVIEIKETKKK